MKIPKKYIFIFLQYFILFSCGCLMFVAIGIMDSHSPPYGAPLLHEDTKPANLVYAIPVIIFIIITGAALIAYSEYRDDKKLISKEQK